MAKKPDSSAASATLNTSTAAFVLPDNFPQLKIDVGSMTSRACDEAYKDWREAIKPLNLPKLTYKDGWHDVTPAMAYHLLANNIQNRPIVWSQADHYARQMADGEWMKTGQPIIIDTNGDGCDLQHRALAGIMSGTTFTSYVVVIEANPLIFAFIDSGKVRTHSDALKTAGYNGVSAKIASTIGVLDAYMRGAFLPGGRKSQTPKLPNLHILQYNEQYPNVRIAVRQMAASDRREAVDLINSDAHAGFIAYMIYEHHGEGVLDDFMEALTDENGEATNPATLLRRLLEKNNNTAPRKRLTRPFVLAYLIKGFNLWLAGAKIKKLTVAGEEPFPVFDIGDADNSADEQPEDAEQEPEDSEEQPEDDGAEQEAEAEAEATATADNQATGAGESLPPDRAHRQAVRAAILSGNAT